MPKTEIDPARRPRYVWNPGDIVITKGAEPAKEKNSAMDTDPVARGLRALASPTRAAARPRLAQDALARGLRKLALDADWEESKHKSGQPGNAGQFGSGGGGAAKAKGGEKKDAGAKPAAKGAAPSAAKSGAPKAGATKSPSLALTGGKGEAPKAKPGLTKPAAGTRGKGGSDLEKTQKTHELIKMLESRAQSGKTTWEDYASGLERLGGDRPSLEAMRRTGMIGPNGFGGFSLAKNGMPSGAAAPAAASSAPAAQPGKGVQVALSFKPVASTLYAKAMAGMPHDEAGRAKLAADITEKLGATQLVADARERLAKAIPTDAPADKGGFKDGEGWTPERMAIHDKLLGEIFTPEMMAAAKPKDGEKPTVSIFGGRGGSGKSFLSDKTKGGPVDAASTVVIDADHFKAHLPGYEGWNAAMFHEESSELFDRAVDIARKLGLNCALDMTLKSSGKAEAYADRFEPDGYHVDGYYMFASPQTATEGAVSRFKNGMQKNGKGRFVPPEIVMGNTKNEENFDRAIPRFLNWAVYDNNDRLPTGPKLVNKGERSK